METLTKNLINAVREEQVKRKMSDRRFSMQVLGISPPYWCLLQAGKRPLTLNLLTLLMQKLPEVEPQVIAYMRDGDKEQ